MNIEQFVEKTNEIIASSEEGKLNVDSRLKAEITVRRVRDYLNKGILEKPERVGKNLDFNQSHIDQLLAIRALQSQGLSDKTLTRSSLTSSSDSLEFGKSYYETSSPMRVPGTENETQFFNLENLIPVEPHQDFMNSPLIARSTVSNGNLEAQQNNSFAASINSVVPQTPNDLFQQYRQGITSPLPAQSTVPKRVLLSEAHSEPKPLGRLYNEGEKSKLNTASGTSSQPLLQKSITSALRHDLNTSKLAASASIVSPQAQQFGKYSLGSGSVDIYINEEKLSQLNDTDKQQMIEDFQSLVFPKKSQP